GAHQLAVRAMVTYDDGRVERDLSPPARTWTIDTVGPAADIDGGPPPVTSSTRAPFSFVADLDETDGEATFECRLDEGEWEACEAFSLYTDLGLGSHQLTVRAADQTGNVGSEASWSWIIDPDASL